MFGETAQFAEGARAELALTPDRDRHPGWRGHWHQLAEGALGGTVSASWYDGGWHYMWQPDDQRWLNTMDGTLHDPHSAEDPVHFQIPETWLRKPKEGA